MSATLIAAIPLALLGVVALMGFIGCGLKSTGDQPPNLTDYETKVKADNPVAYWPLNDAVGVPKAKDATGNNHDGDYKGAIALAQSGLVPGDYFNNTCASFTGGRVDVPWSADFSPPVFTLEAWVQPNEAAPDIRVVVAHEVPSGSMGFALFADSNNNWVARVGDGSVYSTAVGPVGTVKTDSPTFLVVTYDGKTLTLWVNPADTTQAPYASTPAGMFAAVPQGIAFFIGIGHPDQPMPSLPFNGRIQDVAFYNAVLDLPTIVSHFSVGKSAG